MGVTARIAPLFPLTWRGQRYGPKLDNDHIYLPADLAPHEVDHLIRAGQAERIYVDDEGRRGERVPASPPPGPPALRGAHVRRPAKPVTAPKPVPPRRRAAPAKGKAKSTSAKGATNGRQRQGDSGQRGGASEGTGGAESDRADS